MNTFFFNNYEEFGLFLKINLAEFLLISNGLEQQTALNQYIKIFENSKGGCGCSIKRRKKVAKDKYPAFVVELFIDNEAAIILAKNLLNSPNSVLFKKEQTEEVAFFSI